jgi:hypothetical protein
MLKELLQLKEPFYIARHEGAPLPAEREVFLKNLLEQGTSLAAVRGVAWQLLNVIKLLKLTGLRDVWIGEIEEAAQRWAHQQHSNPLASALLQALGKLFCLRSEEVAVIHGRAEKARDSAHTVCIRDR